jgi:hypothetical protein
MNRSGQDKKAEQKPGANKPWKKKKTDNTKTQTKQSKSKSKPIRDHWELQQNKGRPTPSFPFQQHDCIIHIPYIFPPLTRLHPISYKQLAKPVQSSQSIHLSFVSSLGYPEKNQN